MPERVADKKRACNDWDATLPNEKARPEGRASNNVDQNPYFIST